MATDQTYITETIAQIADVAVKEVVQAILAERGHGDELTMCRGDKAGMRSKLGRLSQSYTFTNEVKNIYHTCNVAKAENIHAAKIH